MESSNRTANAARSGQPSSPPDRLRRPALNPVEESLLRFLPVACLGFLLLPGIVSAREIIVAPVGGEFATIAGGVGAAQPGDKVTVRAGIYNEGVSFGRSGAAGAFITLQGDPGAILDGTGRSGQGIVINSRNYIRVIGMTIQNFRGSGTPMGIDVEGSSSSIELRNNLIHHIESPNGNAHGIAFYGSAATPMTNIVVDGNEIRNCKLGQSESLVLNGNVDGFIVARNTVHDNDNIGIDFIGFEGTGPAAQDQARNGVCVENVVYNISSASNPTYGGERSADGIYVDGGRDIVIERNRIDNCDIGVEVASEHSGKTTSNITVRNNFISRGYQGNILMGGYASSRGNAHNVVVINNTTYQATNGEIELQYNCDGITIKNNILYARSGHSYISNGGGNNTNVVARNNIYFGASTTSPGSYPDALARFVNPLLVSPLTDLHLLVGSPASDAGINLGNDAQGQPLSGASDVDGTARVQGGAIDIGADELASVVLGVEKPPAASASFSLVVPSLTRGATAVHYAIPSPGRVTLTVFDLQGRVMDTPTDGVFQPSGSHDAVLHADAWPAGCYFVRLTAAGAALTRRTSVVR
jgi:hypothetical protein